MFSKKVEENPKNGPKMSIFHPKLYDMTSEKISRFEVSGPEKQKTGTFPKNQAMSVFSPYSALTSCKESEISLEAFSGKRLKSLKNII